MKNPPYVTLEYHIMLFVNILYILFYDEAVVLLTQLIVLSIYMCVLR